MVDLTKYLTREEAAKRIGLTKKTLDQWAYINQDRLPYIVERNKAYYHIDVVDAFIEKGIPRKGRRKAVVDPKLKLVLVKKRPKGRPKAEGKPDVKFEKKLEPKVETNAAVNNDAENNDAENKIAVLNAVIENQSTQILGVIAKLIGCLDPENRRLLVKTIFEKFGKTV